MADKKVEAGDLQAQLGHLKHVEPQVKNTLPTKDDIKAEKSAK